MQQERKALSILAYASDILKNESVQATLQSIEHSNQLGDQALACLSRVSNDDTDQYTQTYIDALIEGKRTSFFRITYNQIIWPWMPTPDMVEYIGKGGIVKAGYPELKELPLVVFWSFVLDNDFQSYLLDGTLPWLNTPLPDDKQKRRLFVLALYIWLRMESRYDVERDVTYYIETNKTRREERELFISLFGEYIHTDLWSVGDYHLRRKKGTVMRLRINGSVCGQVVIQKCGDSIKECNDVYMVDSKGIEYTRNLVLVKASSSTPFQCHHCGREDACLFHPNETSHFYCTQTCYDNK